MDYKIYLAGPITGLSWEEATDWRKQALERFQDESKGGKTYVGLSPLRGKEYLKDETEIAHSYEDVQLSSAKMINARDTFDVRRSDLILVNLKGATKVSIGTMLEIGAAFILNKPIIVIMEDGNIHKHPMLSEMACATVPDIDTALYFTFQILG